MKSIWNFSMKKFNILLWILILATIITDKSEAFIGLIVVYCTIDIRNLLIKILEKDKNV